MKKFRTLIISIIALFTLILSGCTSFTTKEATKEPVKVGISWDRDYEGEIPEDTVAYIVSVKKAGATPILLPQLKTEEDAMKALKTVDAVILTGGEDINPAYYNEKPHKNLEDLKEDRDVSDILLLKAALKEDYPILGTCRGMQLLNVVLGGSLYQDFPSEYISNVVHRDPKREIYIKHDSKIIDKDSKIYEILKVEDLKINSWHHQAVKRLGKGLKVTAVAPDGIIEAVELDEKTFVVGVQYHPEQHVYANEDEFLPIFQTLVEYGAKNREKRN